MKVVLVAVYNQEATTPGASRERWNQVNVALSKPLPPRESVYETMELHDVAHVESTFP